MVCIVHEKALDKAREQIIQSFALSPEPYRERVAEAK